MLPGQTDTPSNHGMMIHVDVGHTTQNRMFRARRMLKKLSIKGDNNIVILSYSPRDSSYNFNYSYRNVRRGLLFRRFRRTYP